VTEALFILKWLVSAFLQNIKFGIILSNKTVGIRSHMKCYFSSIKQKN